MTRTLPHAASTPATSQPTVRRPSTLQKRFTAPTLFCLALLFAFVGLVNLRPARGEPFSSPIRVEVLKNVRYGHVGAHVLLLDVYRPVDMTLPRPAIVFIHGGAWIGGDKRSYRSLATELARKGYVGFAVNYRLATKTGNKFPAQLDDVQRAVRWVRANAAEYGVDPQRVAAIGESAGGHLAALLGVRDTRDNSDPALAAYSSRVNCVVDFYGPADFSLTPVDKETRDARAVHLKVFGSYREGDPERFRLASPVTYVDRNSAPFLIFHGSDDHVVHLRQSERLYKVLTAAGVEATLVVLGGEGHGFHKRRSLDRVRAETIQFLDRHLKGSPPPSVGQPEASGAVVSPTGPDARSPQ